MLGVINFSIARDLVSQVYTYTSTHHVYGHFYSNFKNKAVYRHLYMCPHACSVTALKFIINTILDTSVL